MCIFLSMHFSNSTPFLYCFIKLCMVSPKYVTKTFDIIVKLNILSKTELYNLFICRVTFN